MKKITRNASKGFSLLEVLVSIVLITFGIISMLALQARALQYSGLAYYQGIASQIGSGVAASIRANPEGRGSYTQNASYAPTAAIPAPADSCRGAVSCTPQKLALADIYWARSSARNLLPGGDVYMTNDGTYANIVLIWEAAQTEDGVKLTCDGLSVNVAAAQNPQCLALRVRI